MISYAIAARRMQSRELWRTASLLLVSLVAVAPIQLRAEVIEAPEIRFPVEKFQLKNGLTVLMAQDSSAPLISFQTWYRVGSKDEEVGATGLAHLFEHMMFRGTKRFGLGKFSDLVSFNGGTFNAYTTRDSTVYYENIPAGKLELVMELESDRMENLIVNDEVFRAEREVVKEERRLRVEDDVLGQLFERVFATGFTKHPYRWPVVGYMKDLEVMPTEKVRGFYNKFYAPNNAVLVIAGDFDPSKARKWVEKYYGVISAKPLDRTVPNPEPYQSGERFSEVREKVESEYYTLSFLTPGENDEDGFALELLGHILGSGTSSRLYKRLVYEGGLATSAGAGISRLQQHGLFHIFVTLKRGASMDAVQKVAQGEVWSARNKLYSEAEVSQAKVQVMKSYVTSLKTISGKATALGLNESLLGSYEYLFTDLARFQAVTPEKIKQVANKYLTAKRRNTVLVRPAKGGGQ